MSRVLYQSLPIDVSMYKGVSQPCIDIAQQMKSAGGTYKNSFFSFFDCIM